MSFIPCDGNRNPCLGCSNRRVGCHSICERYTTWKIDWDNKKKTICNKKAIEYDGLRGVGVKDKMRG